MGTIEISAEMLETRKTLDFLMLEERKRLSREVRNCKTFKGLLEIIEDIKRYNEVWKARKEGFFDV